MSTKAMLAATAGESFTKGETGEWPQHDRKLEAMDAPPSALYAGSFDPVTVGHLDLIHRGLALFGTLRIAVAENQAKQPLFSASERVALLRQETAELEGVDVVSFSGLVVDYCKSVAVRTLLRGLRTSNDFETEASMAWTNRALGSEIETVFLVSAPELSLVSSRLIREVYAAGGALPRIVTPAVAAALQEKLQ